MNYKLVKHKKWIDKRGCLTEFLTREELEKGARFGHIYFVTFARSGIVRGNHYHTRKEEYFGVAMRKVKTVIEDTKTKEPESFI